MTTIIHTDSTNPHFAELVKALDSELAERDGNLHGFYSKYNKIDAIKQVVVLYHNNQPVACGAIKPYADKTAEVKRMYTLPEHRGKGLAAQVLAALEQWAAQLGYTTCILETGIRQPEAIALYKKCGYHLIPNYGQYAGVDNSVCFEKQV
jgi:GNAT superfamily N-acetyltransferase